MPVRYEAQKVSWQDYAVSLPQTQTWPLGINYAFSAWIFVKWSTISTFVSK